MAGADPSLCWFCNKDVDIVVTVKVGSEGGGSPEVGGDGEKDVREVP